MSCGLPTEAPEGYKPITHRGCGGTYGWVKNEVMPGMRMRAEDALDENREPVLPGTRLKECPVCGQGVGFFELTIEHGPAAG